MSDDLNNFLDAVGKQDFFTGMTDQERAESKVVLGTFVNEARVGYELIESSLSSNSKILEVGAGLCLLSLFLRARGYSVTALEPLAGGFDFFGQLKRNILDFYSDIELVVLEKTIQEVSPDIDGKFDLIFSSNVVEHIDNLPAAFSSMSSVLAINGKMVHGCPNYIIPYEPHFGLPVLFFVPRLTAWIWSARVSQQLDVWTSLNFVTYSKIRKIGRSLGYKVAFRPNLTYNAFERLRDDFEFRSRHKSTIVGRVFNILEKTGTLRLTRYLPAWASTPMIFEMSSTHTNKGD